MMHGLERRGFLSLAGGAMAGTCWLACRVWPLRKILVTLHLFPCWIGFSGPAC
jgi:hypothetical protein